MKDRNQDAAENRIEHGGAFDRYLEQGNQFVNTVAAQLGIENRRTALRITKAVLHSIRDRILPGDAVQFAQGMPLLVKGLYFDQYDISAVPVKMRNRRDFMDYVRSKESMAGFDFLSDDDIIDAIQAVWYALKHHMDYGQVEQVMEMLPMDIRDLFRSDYRQGILTQRD